MTRLATRQPRTRLTNAERSDQVADMVQAAIRVSPLSERESLEILAQRVLSIRDDLHRRTNGKQRTFALTRKIKDDQGEVVEEVPLSDDTRRKMVASVIGAMLVAHHRNTRVWVLDAVDEAISYLPWKVR